MIGRKSLTLKLSLTNEKPKQASINDNLSMKEITSRINCNTRSHKSSSPKKVKTLLLLNHLYVRTPKIALTNQALSETLSDPTRREHVRH